MKLATDMIKRLVSEAKIPGVHFCTLNLEKSVQRVLENLGWGVPSYNKVTNKLIAVSSHIVQPDLHLHCARRTFLRLALQRPNILEARTS